MKPSTRADRARVERATRPSRRATCPALLPISQLKLLSTLNFPPPPNRWPLLLLNLLLLLLLQQKSPHLPLPLPRAPSPSLISQLKLLSTLNFPPPPNLWPLLLLNLLLLLLLLLLLQQKSPHLPVLQSAIRPLRPNPKSAKHLSQSA